MSPEELQPFCELSKSTRYPGLMRPFRIGKWLYATDGRACVRIPANSEALPKNKVPKANTLFSKFRPSRCCNSWPKWDGERRFAKCADCGDDESIEQIAPQRIANHRIAGLYWFKIATLGKVFYYAPSDKEKPIHFVCGKLQGLIMPMNLEPTK